MNTERVLTFASKTDRGGVYISKSHYDLLSGFILSTLEEKEDVALPQLLEEAARQFYDFSPGDLPWHFLRVKYDLEAKGLIATKIERQPHLTQVLRIRKRSMKSISRAK